jgi:hypothetical protein
MTNGLTLEKAVARLQRLEHGKQTKRWFASAHGQGSAMTSTHSVDIFSAIIEQADELRSYIQREMARREARERRAA